MEERAYNFIEEIKKTISDGIPTSSHIVGEIIKTIYDTSSSAVDLAEIIERDPPLTAKILKVANSVYYAPVTKITSLQRSVVVLGFDTIKELVTAITLVHSFFQPGAEDDIDRTGLWIHSVGTAKAAQLISNLRGIERPDVTYTIGLLHDIGKIILALSFPKQYAKVIMYAQQNNLRIIQAEQRLLNIDHCMIGKILCDIWELPDELRTAILYHHNPVDVPDGESILARLVHIGDYMTRKAGIGNPGDSVEYEPDDGAFDIFGGSQKEIKEGYRETYKAFLKEKSDIEGFFSRLR